MAKYKYILTFEDGEEIDSYESDGERGLFSDYETAEEEALYAVSCWRQGAEILHMSNPGDWEDNSDEDVDIEIAEMD